MVAHASPIAKIACAAAGCGFVVAIAVTNDGSASPNPPQGLTATVSGAAFRHSPTGDDMPVMSIRDVEPGRGSSGMVTVNNPTARSRFFWLSPSGVTDRLGPVGGRLSDSLQLSVLDVTRLSSPTSIYRGSALDMGARPLGFLAPGASRTYSFTATVPTAEGANPFEGSTVALSYAWRAIEGSPGPRTAPRPAIAKSRPDSRSPNVRVTVPGRQPLLQARALSFSVSCDESCRQKVDGVVSTRTGRWTVPVATSSAGRGRQSLRLSLPTAAFGAIRHSLISGHDASVALSIRAWDRSGNRTVKRHSIRLESGN